MHIQWQSRRFFPDLYGGVEVRSWQMVRAWREMGHEVSVLTEDYPSGLGRRDEPAPGVACRRLPCSSYGRLWRIAPLVRTVRWLRGQRRYADGADVVIAAYPECVISSRLAMPRRPIVYNCINASPSPSASFAERVDLGQRRMLIARAARCADAVIVASRNVREQLLELSGVRPGKVLIVPHGVDVERFSDAAVRSQVQSLRDSGMFVLAYVGRLHQEKGVDLAIDALARMRGRARAALVIVGSGPEEKNLRRHAQESGLGSQVIFAGRSDAPEQYLAGADAFILPSRVEAFGTALVEAMATGLPCLSWRGGGAARVASDEIIVHERTGFCAEAFDVAEMARYADMLMRDPELCRRMGRAASQRSHEAYSHQQAARRYVELAERLLGGGGRDVSCTEAAAV